MKSIYIIAIILLYTNAWGQDKGSVYDFPSPISILKEHFQVIQNEEVCDPLSIKHQNIPQRSYDLASIALFFPIQILDSTYTWKWDPFLIDWVYKYRVNQFMYDDRNNLISATQQIFDGLDWINNSKFEVVYNTNSKPVSFTLQSWEGYWENDEKFIYTYDGNSTTTETYQEWYENLWHDVGRYIYTYDAQNNLTSESSQYWNGMAWSNEYKEIYNYDENNLLISHISQFGSDSTWKNSQVFFFTYDITQNLISELSQLWNGSTWENLYQVLYTYNVNNILLSKLAQNWNSGTWENSLLFSYAYDNQHHLLSELKQTWDDSTWHNQNQYLYTYDSNDNQTSDLTQKWADTIWQNVQEITHAYDDDRFQLFETNKYFNASGTAIAYGDSTHNYFYTTTGAEDLAGENGSIIVYPNPCSGNFTISTENNINRIEIYNLSGTSIYTTTTVGDQNIHEINLDRYAKGIYILIMYDRLKKYVRRIIVQ